MGKESDDVICIVGMHRSGTSMVARLLNLCGLYLGPEELLLGPDQGNPEGHFEHKGFIEVDEAVLSIIGGSSDSPPDLPNGWGNDLNLEAPYQDAKKLLVSFDQRYPWGWKDPRTTLVIPFWKRLIPNLRFVVCLRNPLEVSRSLVKRDGMPTQKSLYLWYRYTRTAIRDTEGNPRIFVFYEDFFDHADRELKRLLKFCGLSTPTETSAILGTISHDLRRNIAAHSDLLIDQTMMSAYKLLYLSARALSLQSLLSTIPLSVREMALSDDIGRLGKVLEDLHSEEKVIQLQASLVHRDLKLTQLSEEIQMLRTRFDHSLTGQLMKKLDVLKENFLPPGTCRRNSYDRLLIGLKRLIAIEKR